MCIFFLTNIKDVLYIKACFGNLEVFFHIFCLYKIYLIKVKKKNSSLINFDIMIYKYIHIIVSQWIYFWNCVSLPVEKRKVLLKGPIMKGKIYGCM